MAVPVAPTDFVAALNRAWQNGNWALLASMYHPKVVLVPPDLGPNLVGWQAILETYQDFRARAQLHELRVLKVNAHEFEHSQIVHCEFEADYSLDNERSVEAGVEIYVLEQGPNERPRIIWRQQIIQRTSSVQPTT